MYDDPLTYSCLARDLRHLCRSCDRARHPPRTDSVSSLSPDASHIVFSAAGDLWSVSAKGGIAERLTVHPGIEGQSRFSHDGRMLVFESNRDGAQNLYIMDMDETGDRLVGGEIERLTTSDRAQMLGGFSQDGERAVLGVHLSRDLPSPTDVQRAA